MREREKERGKGGREGCRREEGERRRREEKKKQRMEGGNEKDAGLLGN